MKNLFEYKVKFRTLVFIILLLAILFGALSYVGP